MKKQYISDTEKPLFKNEGPLFQHNGPVFKRQVGEALKSMQEPKKILYYQCGHCGGRSDQGVTFYGQYYGVCSKCGKRSNGSPVFDN